MAIDGEETVIEKSKVAVVEKMDEISNLVKVGPREIISGRSEDVRVDSDREVEDIINPIDRLGVGTTLQVNIVPRVVVDPGRLAKNVDGVEYNPNVSPVEQTVILLILDDGLVIKAQETGS